MVEELWRQRKPRSSLATAVGLSIRVVQRVWRRLVSRMVDGDDWGGGEEERWVVVVVRFGGGVDEGATRRADG